jgi:hypothetical protein
MNKVYAINLRKIEINDFVFEGNMMTINLDAPELLADDFEKGFHINKLCSISQTFRRGNDATYSYALIPDDPNTKRFEDEKLSLHLNDEGKIFKIIFPNSNLDEEYLRELVKICINVEISSDK